MISVTRVSDSARVVSEDRLAVEEPLEIRLAGGEMPAARSLSITMRTPGHDAELALGFLYTEGVIAGASDVAEVAPCGPSGNVVRVTLKPEVKVELSRLERNFYTTSSCGVCGKSSIEALRIARPAFAESFGSMEGGVPAAKPAFTVSSAVLFALPDRLRARQEVFAATGGLHACGAFTAAGELLGAYEDVGRHNALDKLIGQALREKRLPLDRCLVLLSGRASFELVQKAAMAGVPCLAAVGAPSSLALELAREAGITLIGFLRERRFNIYCGEERVIG